MGLQDKELKKRKKRVDLLTLSPSSLKIQTWISQLVNLSANTSLHSFNSSICPLIYQISLFHLQTLLRSKT